MNGFQRPPGDLFHYFGPLWDHIFQSPLGIDYFEKRTQQYLLKGLRKLFAMESPVGISNLNGLCIPNQASKMDSVGIPMDFVFLNFVF